MTRPQLVAIADPAQTVGTAGAQLAFDVGRLARACRDQGVPWALWLRAHGWSADRWLAAVRALGWVRSLQGSLGVSAPADGPGGWDAVGLTAAGVARVHVPASAWSAWQSAQVSPPRWVACHTAAEVGLALSAGAAMAVLSPVWITATKPGAAAIGLDALAAACAAHPGRVVALGGVDARTAAQARTVGAAAVATLTAWRADAPALAAEIASAGRMI